MACKIPQTISVIKMLIPLDVILHLCEPRDWSFIFFYVFLVTMLFTLVLQVKFGVKKLFNKSNITQISYTKTLHLRVNSKISLVLSILTMTLIVSIRFMFIHTPQGYDTGIYIYNIQKIECGDLGIVLFSTKVISYLILWSSYRLLSYGDLFTAAILFPYVAGFIFVLLVWTSVKIGYNDDFLLFSIPIISVMSYYFIRVSYDLYSQTIGLGLLYVLLIYLGKSSSNKITRKSIFIKGFLLMLLFLAHFYTALLVSIFVVIMELYRFWIILKAEKKVVDIKTIILIVLSISMMVGIFVFLNLGPIYWLLTIVIPNEFKPFSITPDSFWFAYNEFPLIWVCAIFGILTMYRRRNAIDKILLNWGYYILGIIFITGYIQVYRLLLLLPLAFYSGIGVEYITTFILSDNTLKHITKVNMTQRKKQILATAFILLFFFVTGGQAISRAYIPQYVYYPDEESLNQILWIYNKYGFSNDSIVIPIYNPTARSISPKSSSNIYTWAKAYLGDCIYLGSLIDLLNGIPDTYGNMFTGENRTILLADKLYTLAPIDKLFALKINEIGIYKVTTTNISQIEDILLRQQKWIDNKFIDFYDNWRIISRSLPTKIITREDSLILNFSSSASRGWFTIEHYFITPFNTTELVALVIKMRGHIETEKIYVELYSEKSAFKSSKFTQLYDNYILAIIYLPPNQILNHIRIAVKKVASSSSYEFVEFQYIMLY